VKLLSLKVVRVRGTVSDRYEDEWDVLSVASESEAFCDDDYASSDFSLLIKLLTSLAHLQFSESKFEKAFADRITDM